MIDRKILCNYTNRADGTYYSKAFSPDMFTKFLAELIGNGGSGTVTVKLFGTLEDDATPSVETTATTYLDITLAVFRVASYVHTPGAVTRHIAGDMFEFLSLYKWLRFQFVLSTGGANDADYEVLTAMKTGV